MKQHSEKFMLLATEVKKNISEITLEILSQKQKTNPHLILIDVRETQEMEQGKIPGAIHLSKGIIERDIEKTIPNENTEIVLYCGGGQRSALACLNLQKMGYKNVHSLIGGYRGYVNQ